MLEIVNKIDLFLWIICVFDDYFGFYVIEYAFFKEDEMAIGLS
jgi:hypothetical protein